MSATEVDVGLARLRAAADAAREGWMPSHWTRLDGPEPRRVDVELTYLNHPYGAFTDLGINPGEEVRLRLDLDLPEQLQGVNLRGDRLEMLTMSTFRTSYHRDGVSILDDEVPSVALGPALIPVLLEIIPGNNGELTAVIRPSEHQVFEPFNWIHFTTPRLRDRFELLDLAWAQLFLAAEVAGDQHQAALSAAVRAVPVDLDVAGDSLREALLELAARLAPLEERVRGLRVHVTGHSHIDMNWLWTWPDTVEVIRRDFRSIVAMMRDHPTMTFTHSQPATYRVIEETEPELFEVVRGLVADGRWEVATLQWVEADTNMPSGEATVRQLLEGVAYARDRFGVSPKTFLAPDTFGLSGNLPQLAASAGAEVIYHTRANPGRLARGASWPAYWWHGIDGTRLLAVTSLTGYSPHITAGGLARAAADAARNGLPAGLQLHGVGDHGGGPTRHGLDLLTRLRREHLMPTLVDSSVAAYGREVTSSGCELPVHRGETDTTFEGCYTTHADAKRYNREGENLLQTAESLGVIAGVETGTGIEEAWRTVLFNQFHDILDGAAIHESYDKHAEDFAAVEETANTLSSRALVRLRHSAPAKSVTVTNPLGWDRTEVVSIPAGLSSGRWLASPGMPSTPVQESSEGMSFLARVPAFATVSYVPGEAPVGESAAVDVAPLGGTDLDISPYLRVRTQASEAVIERQSGIIVAYQDRLTGVQLGAASSQLRADTAWARPELGLNVLQVIEEGPHDMSAWNLERVRSEHTLLDGATTRVLEVGPVRAVIEVRRDFRASRMVQRITFYAALARVDFDCQLDWREPGSDQVGIPNLKVAFNGRERGGEAWYEAPYGAVTRPAGGREVPAVRWAALQGPGGGFALLNDCKHGHDALGSRLRLSLVRSAYSPDAIADIGAHRFAYCFLPFQGSWREAQLTRRAAEFNQPLLVGGGGGNDAVTTGRGMAPVLRGAPNILLTALKPARHSPGAVVIRLFDSTGEGGDVELAGLPAGAKVNRANVVEDAGEEIQEAGAAFAVNLRPWEITTLVLQAPGTGRAPGPS